MGAVPGQFTLGWSPGWSDSSLEMTLSCTCCVTVDWPLPFSEPWRGFDPKYEEMKEPPSDPMSTHSQPPSASQEQGQIHSPAGGAAESVLVL